LPRQHAAASALASRACAPPIARRAAPPPPAADRVRAEERYSDGAATPAAAGFASFADITRQPAERQQVAAFSASCARPPDAAPFRRFIFASYDSAASARLSSRLQPFHFQFLRFQSHDIFSSCIAYFISFRYCRAESFSLPQPALALFAFSLYMST